MEKVTILSSRDHPKGEVNTDEYVIAEDVARIRVSASKENWPDAGIGISVEISEGREWRLLGGFEADGKPFIRRNGQLLTHASIEGDLPATKDRRLRIRLNCKEPLKTGIDIETWTAKELEARVSEVKAGRL